ncbi:putative N-acetyltransferase YhbS [Bradyrhizobium sp. AZCC 1721]
MSELDVTILAETPKDAQAIERLHERTFGPGRFVLSAYRLREHVDHLLDLSFTARIGTLLVGSVRQLPICIGDTPALMLGPLTVEPPFRKRGVGRMLLDRSLQDAKAKGHRLVILVGDEPYYSRVGFRVIPKGRVTMPGPRRLQPPVGGRTGRGRVRRRVRQYPAGLEQGAIGPLACRRRSPSEKSPLFGAGRPNRRDRGASRRLLQFVPELLALFVDAGDDMTHRHPEPDQGGFR